MRVVTGVLGLVALVAALALVALARNGALSAEPPGLGARVRLALGGNAAKPAGS